MRTLLIAAAVIAVGSLGMASRASAQAYYPGSDGAPAARGGYYPYPGTHGGYPGSYGTYPSYPRQSATARSHRRDDDDRYDRRAHRDDDYRQYERRDQYDSRGNYGSGVGVNAEPSRVADHGAAANGRYKSRSGYRERDSR